MAKKKTLLEITLDRILELYKRDLAVIDTQRLRSHAIAAGLDPAAAATLTVVPSGKTMGVKMDPDFSDHIYTFAYGNSSTPPTPVIQSYMRGDL
jgi:hypothetical protein